MKKERVIYMGNPRHVIRGDLDTEIQIVMRELIFPLAEIVEQSGETLYAHSDGYEGKILFLLSEEKDMHDTFKSDPECSTIVLEKAGGRINGRCIVKNIDILNPLAEVLGNFSEKYPEARIDLVTE